MDFSKKVFLVFVCILLSLEAVCAQNTPQQETVSGTASVQENSHSIDETSISLEGISSSSPVAVSPVSTLWLFVRMILVLAVVVCCIYGVLWLFKRSAQSPESEDPFLRQVSSVSLGNGKSAQVITLIDRAYIIGVSDASVNLLAEITDKELVDAMNLYSDERKHIKKPRSFSDILDIFMQTKSSGKGSVFSASGTELSDMLKRQRERINGGQ